MATISVIKAGISWNKSTGIIQASGIATPSSNASGIGVGDSVRISFYNVYTSPQLELKEWRCAPNGWVFAAKNRKKQDLIGEYNSIFKCLSMYNSLSTDQDKEDFLDKLVLYDSSKVRETESPYAGSGGWWRLADMTGWRIPSLANIYVSTFTSTEWMSSIDLVNAMVPLMGQLFFMDAFSGIISMIKEIPTVSTGTRDISVSTYLDLREVDNIDLMGSKGDPTKDPREAGPGKTNFIVQDLDNEDVLSTSIIEEFTKVTWMIDSVKYKKTHGTGIWMELGRVPAKIEPSLDNYIRSLIVPTDQSSTWSYIINTSYDMSMKYYNLYSEDRIVNKTINYSFTSCHEGITPTTHMNPLPDKALQLTAQANSAAASAALAALGFGDACLTLDIIGFQPTTLFKDSVGEQFDKTGLESQAALDLDESKIVAARYSVSEYNYTTLCSATSGENSIPYLFRQDAIITKSYQAGLFILNLDSKFWVTPGAGDDLGAVDPAGVRVWLGPFDNPKGYAYSLATIEVFKQVMDNYGADNQEMQKTMCLISFMGYMLKEGDIVIAAICDQLSLDAPQAYIRHYDEYFESVKNWFFGQFNRLSGLQYSFKGSHKGLSEGLNAMATKYGSARMKEIFERIMPGTKIEDLNDAAGRSYCRDMLSWIADNGVARVALFNDSGEGGRDGLVRATGPLLESVSTATISGGVKKIVMENRLTGDISVSETPVTGHPEYIYVSPRYVQLSTITNLEDDGTPVDFNSAISNKILQTKVMEWERLFRLKELYAQHLLGKEIIIASETTNYTESPNGVGNAISSAMSNIGTRNFKLSVTGNCDFYFSSSYIAELR
jgi:hypothetical protein